MSQALIKAHQLAQIRNGGAVAAAIKELGNRLKRGSISPEEFVIQTVAFQLLTHNQAVALAKQYLQESRAEAGVGGQIVTPIFSKERAFGQAANTAAQLAKKTLSEAALNAAINELAVSADKAAKTAGRQTVIRSTEASGRAWRRVSDGNPCAFCAMLVSRGPVYTSSQAAGEVVGVRGVARGKRKTGELFHDHCGCTVVESYGSWADWKPTAREQEFIDLYNRSGGNLKYMREDGQGILSDATIPESKRRKPGPKPKAKTGGAGGGKRPPSRGAGPFREMPDPPKDPRKGGDKKAWFKYWADRQNHLPFDFQGQCVDAGEVMSYERLARLGEKVQPIPKKKSLPTNDFIWLSNNSLPTEMKTVRSTSYEAIMGRIHSAVKAAKKNHNFTKDIFLIDIGDKQLTDGLAKQLRNYNIDRSKYAIKELWVMHSNGLEVKKIALL